MDDQTLGHYITVVSEASGSGDAFVCVSSGHRELVIEPVLPGRVLPRAGERVRCLSRVGQWDSQASVRPDGTIALAIPPWVARATTRQAVRVGVGVAVTVMTDDELWPARMTDLSVTGASVAIESVAAIDADRHVSCTLPEGTASARVMSVRSHEHPLLDVLGVAWRSPDPVARAWITRTVAQARTAVQP